MNFTEEDFYGNKQGKVLEDGEVEYNLNKIEQNNNLSNSKLALAIVSTFLKTIVALIGSLFYLVSVLVCLSPAAAIKFFDFAKLDNASLYCYERIYEKEKTLASLYNLVQKSIENKDYKKTNKYIDELQGKSDYVTFCIKVNEASTKSVAKEYIAYVGDLDGYLVSQNILALYSKNKKQEAQNVAEGDLVSENIYSFGLSTYVNCVVNDAALTDAQKTEFLALLSTKEVSLNNQTKTLIEFVSDRLEALGVTENLSVQDKILRTYTSLKINNFLLKVYEAAGNTTEYNQTSSLIAELQAKYNNLIK